ncbi:uncharacterized protein [Onthophagus taurus]|uniref:uncharacterized protein n=1 Tax=Onthophagus taurus TaxID=166361 RepID=UPI0039BDE732
MANVKWDCETTIKFIQSYKLHPCLWNFESSEYKNKQKRDAAYVAIAQDMNIAGFRIQDVKNKIKNLRSTYSQELKKLNDSKKSGAGLGNVYISNIKWLKEMEEVFVNDLRRKTYENTNTLNQPNPTNTNADDQESVSAIPLQSCNLQEVVTTTSDTTITTPTISNTGNTPRAKKRSRDIVKAISDLKSLHEEVNCVEESAFDVFGKSVAMQLKGLSVENALLAQCRIQSILTEFGIKDCKEKTASRLSVSNYSSRTPSPASSYASDTHFNDYSSGVPVNHNTVIDVHRIDDPPMISSASLTPLETTTNIITLAMTAALNNDITSDNVHFK